MKKDYMTKNATMLGEFERVVQTELIESIQKEAIDLFHCLPWNEADRFVKFDQVTFNENIEDEDVEVISSAYTLKNIQLIEDFIADDELNVDKNALSNVLYILDICETELKNMRKFSQVVVWPATIVGKQKIEEFEEYIKDEFDVEIEYLEEVTTLPDIGDTKEETGGRNDVFFCVKDTDVEKFAVPRLKMGMRWVEDALSDVNGYNQNPIYPERIKEYITWDANGLLKESTSELTDNE